MENYLEHKGFRGSVEYSRSDDILYGKVQSIRGLVLYEGKSLDELKEDFCGAVDDYIKIMQAHGQSAIPPVYKESLCSCPINR